MEKKLEELRQEMSKINFQILDYLSRRGRIAEEIGQVKIEKGMEAFDPARESEMLEEILQKNEGRSQMKS